jgi:hypothetical protein
VGGRLLFRCFVFVPGLEDWTKLPHEDDFFLDEPSLFFLFPHPTPPAFYSPDLFLINLAIFAFLLSLSLGALFKVIWVKPP